MTPGGVAFYYAARDQALCKGQSGGRSLDGSLQALGRPGFLGGRATLRHNGLRARSGVRRQTYGYQREDLPP